MAIESRRSFIKIIPFVGVGLLAACSEKPKTAVVAAASPAPVAAPTAPPAVAAVPAAAAPAPAIGSLPMVAADDATAVALGYSPDATKVDKAKYVQHVEGTKCGNCSLFQGTAGNPSGGCPLFPGKQVSSGGWCSAYVKKVS